MQFIHGDCNHLTMEINYQTSHTNPNSKSSSTTPLRKQKQKYICHKMSSDYHPVTVSEILPITPKLICENQNMPRHVNYYLGKSYPKIQKHLTNQLHKIPTEKSHHPLELSITTHHIQAILSTYDLASSRPDTTIFSINNHPIPNLSRSHFQEY